MALKWRNSRMIGEQLYDLRPDIHPLSVRFSDLHQWVVQLPAFEDDPNGSNEGLLEGIQMIWYEEWQEDHDPSEDPYAQTGTDRRKG
jgi:FeS assembly protein IscX